jgi:2-polyprenyl-6-methoxyphenol hydroxylase-like FAD-dependent oxidoreductase
LLLRDFLRSQKLVDVFIIGGGPAGLAAAIAARRHGLSVAVADGATPPIDKPCGEGLMPDGLKALRELGITIPADACQPFRGIRFVSGNQEAEAVFPRGHAHGIRRTVLHQLLVDHAASCGVSMLWQTPVVGVNPEGVLLSNGFAPARWIVGADGSNSRVRRWAGLDRHEKKETRFGFRRHYRVAPWSDFMELHWADDSQGNDPQIHDSRINDSQIYVTPVSRDEICLALVSSNAHLRLDAALTAFRELAARFEHAEVTSSERGAITVSRRLRRVHRENIALIGDASGGVDAITGEGLCLGFRQASPLADCLAQNDLARYEIEHRRLLRRPAMMSRLMLLMGRHPRLRRRAMQVFQSSPGSFARMLAMHVGEGSTGDYIANGISFGWRVLTA